jgi:hypothetical protein
MATWHFTTWLDLLDHWQTLIAGALAVLAAVGTIWATIKSANREIAASQAQTDVAQKQIETTIHLARIRAANEARAFHAMLKAAMTGVLTEVAWAKSVYPQLLPMTVGSRVEALAVRNCITKGAFAELRGACVRQGSPLTGEFLDLERQIDSFVLQLGMSPLSPVIIAGLGKQLDLIEAKAAELRRKAIEAIESEETTHRADN